ncbi:MAG: AAA family ATPase [Bacteroidaceae bacterium]|nr:AAA family ATPase [Bacteroidaceae bacterium]
MRKKINKIKIRGYKSIKDQTVEMKNLNVLIGSNGIGKTNFVSVFDLLKSLYRGNLQEFVLKNRGANKLLYMGAKNTDMIVLEVEVDDEGKKRVYEDELLFVQDSLVVNYSGITFWQEHNVLSISTESKKELPNQYMDEGMHYFGDDLQAFHFHDTTMTSKMKMSQSVSDNRCLRSDGSNIAAYLYFLQKVHPKHFARIEAMVRSVSPFFEGFALQPNRLNTDIISLEWKQKGCEDYFDAYQLSDGTLRFICLVTLLMQPEPPAIIIIDEPEIGLHPQAINRLASIIKRTALKSQIVICTQSNYLVDNFAPEDVLVADRQNNATTFRRLGSEELNAWLEEYSLGEIWEMNIIGGQPS